MPRKPPANAGDQEMFDLLARIDELESLLEVMDEEGLRTREDVATRIAELEAQAEQRERTND
jgi:hypothetical protein